MKRSGEDEFKKVKNFSYEDFNQFLFNKVIESDKVCDYYIADFGYNNEELTDVFYIDTYNHKIYWLNDWFEGGTINCLGLWIPKQLGIIQNVIYGEIDIEGVLIYESNHN